MLKFAPLLLVFALMIPETSAAASPVEQAFGATVVSTYPDGRTGLLWLNKDGTYTAKGRRRTDSSGKWSLKGGKVCLKQAKPMAAPMTYCTTIPSNAGASSWRAKAVTGEPITVKIVHGTVK
jgi:hypothetical protein